MIMHANHPQLKLDQAAFLGIFDYISTQRTTYVVNGVNKMESIVIDDIVLDEDIIKVWVGDEFSGRT